jgi:hypothetical protein
MMDHDFGPAQNAEEQLRRWDGGGTIWSIEMGGLGPGYEQAIQLLAVEITRDELGKPLPTDGLGAWGDATVGRLDAKQEDGAYAHGGFSGAQVGAAKSLAYQWLTVGPAELLSKVESDRRIQVSAFWPTAPKG